MRELELLRRLRAERILIWAKGEDRLGFSVPAGGDFPETLREQVREAKERILQVLRFNGVDSAEQARRTTYYRIPDGTTPRVLQSIQKGMYLQSRIDELGYTYTIPLFVQLDGADPEIAEQAVRALIAQEPILRMQVHEDLTYDILPAAAFEITRSRLTTAELEALRGDRARTTFPLAEGRLLLPEVVEVIDGTGPVVGLTHHHMLSDAYSAEVITDRLARLYTDLAAGRPLPENDGGTRPLNYFDYLAHQEVELRSPGYTAARKAFGARLAAAEKPQLRRSTIHGTDNRATTLRMGLDPQLYRTLTGVAREHQLSMYSLLFTGLYHVLSTFMGGQTGFAVATTVGNRPVEFESAVGPFLNTLPLIPEYRPEDSFLANARRVNDAVIELNQYHQLNLDMLADAVPDGAAGLADLVQVLFTMHNFRVATAETSTVDHRMLPYEDLAEKFGITIIAREEEGGGLALTVTYAHARYESGLVHTLFDAYLTFLRSLARSGVDEPIARLDLVDDTGLELIERINRTAADQGDEQTAVEMFQRQVERTPDHVAVIYRDRRLTYRELNEHANRLAHLLIREHGVRPGSLVGLLLDRSEHMLVAILAVLKAGCAYVPIDPELPAGRIRFILEDTAAPLVLTDRNRAAVWAGEAPCPTVPVDAPGEAWSRQPVTNPDVPVSGTDLAYVIYTSGTTGQPKGVLCEHRGLVNRIRWMNKQYPLRHADRVLQKTPYVFDVSVWELLWANWYGAAVVFAEPGGHKDPEYLTRLVEREQVTVTHFVPSMLGAFLEALRTPGGPSTTALRSLRYVFCSGEALKLDQVRGVHELLPWVELHNLYGPTEASIDVLFYDCTDRALEQVLIGRPIDNMRVYVLNKARKPLPPYAIGELYLGGVGLARGYLNRPELTAERFVDDPFTPGERLYRTGDLVRLLPGGDIDYIGRDDFQVKIRGYRIELGEVEAALERHPEVRRGVVTVWQPDPARPDHRSLAGYYVADHPLDEAELRRTLHAVLPDYMVPSALIHLTEVPVTVNGKLDRRALPTPNVTTDVEGRTEARDQREALLRELCAQSLGLRPEELGFQDDLTRRGMDSIVAIRLTGLLRLRTGLPVTVRDVFAHRTVERLYDHLSMTADGTYEPLVRGEQGRLDGEVDLLPIQSWFFDQPLERPEHWNQAFLVRTPELSLPRLERALRALVDHHDAFRLRFRREQDEVVQYYDPAAVLPGLNVLDVRDLPGEEGSPEFARALHQTLTSWQRGFDLQHGPLHAVGYLHGFADGSARVFFALHHLIVDTVSWQVLADDLRRLYEDPDASPGEKGASYRQWVDAVAEYARNHQDELAYWDELLADLRSATALGDGVAHPPSAVEFTLDEYDTQLLLGDCHRAYHTRTEDLLLTALGYALRAVTGDPTHHVLLEGHGREEIAPGLDVTRTLGWFTTLYPVRLVLDDDLGASVRQVKEALRTVPTRGLGFGALTRYRERPLPPVWFNYLGQVDGDGGDWRVVMEDAGTTMSSGAPQASLTIFAYVAAGRLQVRVDSRMDADTTSAVARELERALTELIAHCRAQEVVRYTPSDFREVRGEADLAALPPAIGADPYGWFDMTEIQKAYLVGRLGNYEIGNVANHVYGEYVYPDLDTDRLEEAINQLVAECDVLRTVFSFDRLQQRVLPVEEVPRYRLQVHHVDQDGEEWLARVRERLSHQLHDPENFPLFAFEVSRLPDRCVLHTSFDLIVLDVQSRLALLRRLDDIYRGRGERKPLPVTTFKDYQDYAGLLRASRWYEEDRAYWQQKLTTLPLRCELPFRVSPDTVVQPRFDEHTLRIEAEVWQRFREQAARRGLSVSSVLLSLFGSVIAYFSGAQEFPITVTLFNRYPFLPDTQEILGNFTSTVLHHFVDDDDVERLTRRTHDVLWEDVAHALYSGVQVQRDLSRAYGLDSTRAVSPIVFTGAVGSHTRDFESAAFLRDDEVVAERHWSAQTSQAWIDLQAVEVEAGLVSKWLYVSQLFDRPTIEHLNRLFCRLIERLAGDAWQDGLPREAYLPDADRALIEAANETGTVANERTLFGLVEERCRANGAEEAVAVVDAGTGRTHTYGELVEQSAALARLLHARTGRQEQLVAVLAEKGYVQVLATSAIMKAGLGYLPLHVDWPVARLDDILTQAGVRTVLVSRAQAARPEIREYLAAKTALVIEDALAEAPVALPLPEVSPDDVAYVIFTSGSTGKPKGVTISHRGAVNTIVAVNARFGVGPADRVLALSELSFDLSVYDIFGVLAAGGTVVFPAQERTKDPAHWVDLVERHGVTLWNSVPQLAGLLADEATPDPARISTLRAVLMSGDWIPTTLPDRIRSLCPGAVVMSLGGATEGSIWSIWYEIGEVDPAWTSIPYGVAMPGQTMYVLNARGEHCPVGVTGEIHIGGAGVALNYWRDEELTRRRFFEHPVLGRLYRTGDLGRWSRQGYIEFLGRNDFQVKLNGYRVELGEIEHALTQYPGVTQSVAVVHERGGQILVGYYVSQTPLDTEQMRAFLAERLPEYMVPDTLVHLTELPLSPNGKLDRRALPEPEAPAAPEYVAPRTPREAQLRDLWAEVLGVPRQQLGIRDDLLRLGVDSIAAIRLVSRLRKQLGVAVGVGDVFAHRTIERFHDEVLRTAESTEAVSVRTEQGTLAGDVPLLPIQSWFFAQNFPRAHHWNQAFLIHTPHLDPERLRESLRAVVAQHDALRLRYHLDGGDVRQYYDPDAECPPLRVLDVRDLPAAEGTPEFGRELDRILTEWQSGFDLRHGPVLAAGYLHGYADGSSRVFLAAHHLVVDTVSWRVLAEDLRRAYEGESLGEKGTSYRQWGEFLAEYAQQRTEERSYWDTVSVPEPDVLLDPVRAPYETELEFDEDLTRQLLHECQRMFRTRANEFLLAAFAHALTALTGRPEHGVVLEGHGREDLADGIDVTRTVGWFTTLFPCRLVTADDPVETLKATKENLRAIPANGLGYGLLVGHDRSLPRVCFNYLGQVDGGDGDHWRITGERGGQAMHPDNVLPYTVNLAGMVVGGRLQFRLTSRLTPDDTERLARAFEASLTDLVRRTAGGSRTYLTSSDVDGVLPQEHLDRLQADREVEDVLTATGLQQGLVAHALRQGDVDDAYRVQAVWDYRAEIDPELLRRAWAHAQEGLASLRTSFDWQYELVQVVARHAPLHWRFVDLSGYTDPQQQERAFDELLRQDRETPYDMGQPGLFRVYLVKRGERHYTCLLNTHHAILDGWSSPLLLAVVHTAYLQLRDGEPLTPVADTHAACQRFLQRHAHDHDAFWRDYVRRAEESCDLTGLLRVERRNVDLATYRHVEVQGRRTLVLDAELLAQLRELCGGAGVTLNAVLQYAWHRLLATYGNCATTVVGTVLSGRDLPVEGIETAVGLYLSTVPLIMNHTRGTGVVLDEIRRLQQDIHEINSRSTVDLAALQSAGRRLFDSLFIYENYPAVTDPVHERELHPEFRFRHQKRDYPLVVTVTEQGDEVVLGLDFAEDLIHPATAERLLSGVDSVLKQLVRQPDLTVDHLQLADPTDLERQRRWNDTGAVTPEDPVIHRIFERHAAATPHATAVEHDGRRLTYAELNAAANRLARLLRRDGVRCGDPVLLLLDRDEHVVTSLLAVLKAGGVYVPLDPGYPDGRIARIVQGSGAGVVLTRLCHVDRIRRRWPALTVVALDDPQVEERIAAEPGENLELPLTGDEPAYILYTSGSTGVPKGVMVEHRAFTTTVEAVRSRHFAGRGALRTYSMTNYVFDIFGLEYGLTLLTGGSLVIGSPLAEGPDGTGLDFLQMTPSLLEMKLDGLRATEHLRLLVGGERLERHLLRAALPRFAEVVNVYGPTETTIWSTSKVYRGRLDETTPVTIGRALPGERAHVLDPDLRPLPVGAVGELYLSGSGLAREYVNDAELTARRFLPNPFHQPGDGHDRLYRTGDLVRWLETGELEFVGRVDNQVKLRGHRIELGEVENALVSFPGVRQAVARIVAPDPAAPAVAHRLVGYYVPGTGQDTLDEEALAAHLADVLPEHMRPDVLVRLTEIPLTYSGKLDVAALPVPERKNDRDHVPPRGELETVLAQVWQDVLGLERVGVHDRFFDLGGNSVLLTKVHGRLPEEIRRQVRLTDLFTHPTIAALSAYIAGQRAHTADVVRVGSSEPAGPGGVGSRDVAVIGMACRFPDADDVDEYWRNLTEGRNSIVHYSREELLAAGVPEAVLDQPGYVRAQSRLRDIRSFDAAFFGYSRREAEIMDPQHRLFLECAWHALEDAFCDPYRYEGAIGLFASVGQNNYLDDHVRPALAAADLSDEYQAMINNRADFLCTKVAYRLNLTGPAVTVQTACSSSLVAVHQACVALLAGDCDIALAGGVSIGKLGKEGYLYQEGMVFSPDGTCRAFDAGARGTVEGQGVGIVVLKPLERALADGDPIRAVIKGSAINNDGHDKVGYTAPSPRRQAAVIRSALRRAGVDPATISYIETHGTGTPLGDPIEFEGLMEVFGGTGARCALGAVKTNIGHLDVASGIAGLIKAVLCLEHRTLVPTLHYRTPNPRIDLEHSPFHVNTECRPWTGVDGVLRAGISSFGIGGTNAHVVLEAAPSVPPSGRRSDRAHQLLVVSGRTPEAVRRQSRRLADFLADNPGVPVERVAHTLLSARRRFEYSAVVVGRDRQELVQRLTAGDAGCVPGREGRPTVFLFPGQGTQYTGMGRALYESEPVFRAAVDECRALLRPHLPAGAAEEDLLGWTDRVNETRFTQPALFVLEYALARWFLAMGVRPDALIGHSLGEYVAACLAGVFSLDDALRLVCERGRLLDSTAPGAMLAVPLPVEGTLPHLQGEPLDVAVVNEHGSCVVAGEPDAVDRLAERLAADGVPSRRLAVTRAFHSRMLDPVLDEFTRVLEGIELHKPEIPFVSNLTGDWADPAEVTQPRYWVDQLRNQVAFAAGLDTLHDSAATRDAVLVELGPGQVLTRLARRHVRREGHPVVPAMPRAEHAEREPATLVEALGAVHAAGVDVDSQAFHGLFPGDRVRLPGYAFARVEHWLDRSGRSVAPAPESARVEPTTTSGSSLAAVVEQAWTSVLGVSRVQKDDDFFAQGGDSLAAVQFVTRIERALGVRVEFMELEQHTPAAVLRWLQEHTGAERHDRSRSVVRIRQGDPSVSPPLLLVHPIGGDVYFYRELAQCLPETQPVYAIRSPMLDGTAEFDTIEQMAASYVDMLGELGVTPPYRLGGASFGGIVAYEMAQQVGKRTGHWPDVVLIDSPAHGNLPEQMDERAILGYLARYGLTGLNFSVAELEALESAEERIRYLAARSRGTVFEELLSEEFLPVYLRTWRRHGEAMHRYVPSPYPGNIVFFSHQEVIPEFPTGQDRYWRRLARGKWRHVPVSGNHLSMTALPHVARIGAELAGLNWEEER